MSNSWRLRRVRGTKFGKNVFNKMFLNAAKLQGCSFYRFLVIRENHQGWITHPIPLLPPRLGLIGIFLRKIFFFLPVTSLCASDFSNPSFSFKNVFSLFCLFNIFKSKSFYYWFSSVQSFCPFNDNYGLLAYLRPCSCSYANRNFNFFCMVSSSSRYV